MAGVVGVGILIEWLQDWGMLRTLQRHLAKTRAERKTKCAKKTRKPAPATTEAKPASGGTMPI